MGEAKALESSPKGEVQEAFVSVRPPLSQSDL
jgi:hypothetical protein